MLDKHLLRPVWDDGDQAQFVATDIEHMLRPNLVCGREQPFQFGEVLRAAGLDQSIPSLDRRRSLWFVDLESPPAPMAQ